MNFGARAEVRILPLNFASMKLIFSLFLGLATVTAFAQSNYAPLNESYYHWIDRYEIKAGRVLSPLFTTVKPYKRADIVAFLDSAAAHTSYKSRVDEFNYNYLRNDSWEWSGNEDNASDKPVFRHFYKKKSDFFYVIEEPDFDLHINPVLYVGAGQDSRLDDYLYINTRGAEIRGMIDRKVGFYLYLTDTQARLPAYVMDITRGSNQAGNQVSGTGVLPHEGFWKNYDNGAVDFLQTRGYITFEATKHINMQFGYDRFFIGNGMRSLIFSDHAPPATFLKTNVKVWKLNYMFFLNRMVATRDFSTGKYPEKYVAVHHLSINIGKRFNLGLFESVVFNQTDSTSFEWNYLNPIIFYRAVEQQFGSSDNAMLGLDFKWNAFRGVQFYGQFVLDEFLFDNLKAGTGWWANKFAVQAGMKYIDAFGIDNLDLQGEFNLVKPYTYSHFSPYGSYSSYRQPIAHPLGANFTELIGVMRYQPVPKLNLVGKLMLAKIGRDTVGVNWGGDILKDYTTREQEFGNSIGQGVDNEILTASLTASWMLKHNLFLDATAIIRKSESPVAFYNTNSTITSLSLRWNIAQRLNDF